MKPEPRARPDGALAEPLTKIRNAVTCAKMCDYHHDAALKAIAALEAQSRPSSADFRAKVEALLKDSEVCDANIDSEPLSKAKKLRRHNEERGAQAALKDILALIEASERGTETE